MKNYKIVEKWPVSASSEVQKSKFSLLINFLFKVVCEVQSSFKDNFFFSISLFISRIKTIPCRFWDLVHARLKYVEGKFLSKYFSYISKCWSTIQFVLYLIVFSSLRMNLPSMYFSLACKFVESLPREFQTRLKSSVAMGRVA